MRILQVVAVVDDEYTYGGPLTVAVQHSRVLAARGHDVTLAGGWLGAAPPPTTIEGVPARLYPLRTAVPGQRFSGLLAPALLRWLWRSVRDHDVVHVHLARDLVPLTAARIAAVRGVPTVVMCHGMVVPDDRRAVRVVDRVFTVSALRRAAVRFVLTPAEDAAVATVAGNARGHVTLPQSVDVPEPADDGARPDPPEVLFLARLHPRKRVLNFLRAAAVLVGEGSPAVFRVVGPDDGDLPLVHRFLDDHPELAGRVEYLGPLAHDVAVERFRTAAVYVLPSADEPMPMTMLEAAARATPSVCTVTCGLAGPLASARAGTVVPDDDVDALVRAVRDLLADPDERAATGRRARDFAAREYGPDAVGTLLEAGYATAVAARS